MTNETLKNVTDTLWNSKGGKYGDDYYTNTYDSIGRIIHFSSNPSLISSYLGYSYNVYYNSKNQINCFKSLLSNEVYIMFYDKNENIKAIYLYFGKKLIKKLVNSQFG